MSTQREITITISVNIAANDELEGNAELKITLPVRYIDYLDRNKLATNLDQLLDEALGDYYKRNR